VKATVAAFCVVLASSLSLPAAALSSEPGASSPRGPSRVVEVRVNGDASALSRVKLTARELLSRLDVEPNVESIDEPPTSPDEPPPLVIAYVDLRDIARPSIDIEDGRTRQELTRRNLVGVSSLETGVEAVLHVLYLAVESSLAVSVPKPSATTAAPTPGTTAPRARGTPAPGPSAPPAGASPASMPPGAARRATTSRATTPRPEASAIVDSSPGAAELRPGPPSAAAGPGLDVGLLLRLSSLGGSRIVPGAGASLEPRTDWGRLRVGLMLSGVVHAANELSFAGGTADVRPMYARVIPTLDWLLSPDLSATAGLGAGLDAFAVEPLLAPVPGRVVPARTAVDPVVSALAGARVPIGGRLFLSALASLDVDVQPTVFVARLGDETQAVLQLPRVRAGLLLAMSFSAAGPRRFPAGALVEQ
jgi:hypothetical protein